MKGEVLREIILNANYLRGVQRLRALGSEIPNADAELIRSVEMEGQVDTLLSKINSKVYPNRIAMNQTLPCLVYQAISVQPNDTKSGPSALDEKRWQVNVYQAEYDVCEEIMSMLRVNIDRFTGIAKGVEIQGVQYQDQNDQFSDSGEVQGISTDYKIRAIRTI